MKKFIFIFIVIFSFIITTGCSPRTKTVKFNPITTENSTDAEIIEKNNNLSEDSELGPDLAIISFKDNLFNTTSGYHVIRGTTPKNTHTIKINDYTLSKYYPGQAEWSYIASANLNTLNEGKNIYTVYALDKEGNEIDSQEFTVIYNASENLPSVGSSGWIALILSLMISIGYFVINQLRRIYIKNI